MSERVVELFRTMVAGDLETELRGAASHAGVATLEEDDLRHLVRVMTSYSLVVTSLSDLVKFTEMLDTQIPHVLGMLATSSPDEDAMHRVLAVPDHVRLLGDKCLFEAGVARRRGPKGMNLADVGRRSYQRASQILAVLGEDRRLRLYYEQNALQRSTLDDEVRFLARCAEMFGSHVKLLNELLHGDHDAVTGSSHAISGSHGHAPDAHEPAAAALATTKASTALAARPLIPAAVPRPKAVADDSDGPARVVDLHIAGHTDEEIAESRARDLIAAEKTVLFSLLDSEVLRRELKKVVIHQEGAIDSLCDEICLYATGTQDPRKPASYFLVGPTGVGKNYLVESLLKLFERLWGIEVPYLELEGPEFTYPSDINELKGAARGFIRSDEEGIMTQFHKRSHDKPFSVILVDEVEKAHPQLRRFFLPIMDRGTMMDNRGRTLHFANTTIFFTSNIGYSEAARSTSPIGFGDEDSRDRQVEAFVESRMRKTLSPEFINRIHCIHFEHLTREAVDDIFDLEMTKIRRRYRQAQDLDVVITPAARLELLKRGYDRDYGARNLAKVLNRWANIEVSKTLKRDEDKATVDVSATLTMIREMREGRRAFDMEQVQGAVQDAARVRVPYRQVTVDVEAGELIYKRG